MARYRDLNTYTYHNSGTLTLHSSPLRDTCMMSMKSREIQVREGLFLTAMDNYGTTKRFPFIIIYQLDRWPLAMEIVLIMP